MNFKTFKKGVVLGVAIVAICALSVPTAFAQTPQVPLPGSSIPQWVNQLPVLAGSAGTPIMESVLNPSSNAGSPTQLYMREFLEMILPASTPFAAGTNYLGTSVFGYRTVSGSKTDTYDTYIGPVFVASRGTPTAVKYFNNLGTTTSTDLFVWKFSFDQSLHWANPNRLPMFDTNRLDNYSGPIPAVAHLHGGEVPAAIDGGPDAWFLSRTATDYDTHGSGYYTYNYDPTSDADNNFSVYRYPNTQEAAPIWFHDHLLGGTRINVYAGLAGAYLLTDPDVVLPAGLTATGLDYDPANSPGTDTSLTIPLVLQDRMFDVNGQLYFPDMGLNPGVHPFWIPEFVGDTIVVNGKAWPNLNVEAKRYRFLMINGSNARFYELSLSRNAPMFVIGTDGGFLDNAVQVSKLVIGPGERYQLIIDFGRFAGRTVLMTNTGRTPFPKGAPPQGSTVGRIVQFTVSAPTANFVDNSFNPAGGTAIRTGAADNPKIQRLVTPPGTINSALTVAQTRQLTLNEVIGPGGPLEILVNNTKWSGERPTSANSVGLITGFSSDGTGNYLSELPAEGTTEVWEIINLTADAHPIHLHLVQFQILNRENFNVNAYMGVYNGTFPAAYDFTTNMTTAGGVFVPAYGPPANYFTGQDANGNQVTAFLGGNPDVTPYLQGKASPADPNEAGWKDTAIMYPGQVTRIVVRFMPTDTAPGTTAYYPFIPNPTNPNADSGAGILNYYNFVWHCHIVDHEDNEMMRPYQVVPASVDRTYVNTDPTPSNNDY